MRGDGLLSVGRFPGVKCKDEKIRERSGTSLLRRGVIVKITSFYRLQRIRLVLKGGGERVSQRKNHKRGGVTKGEAVPIGHESKGQVAHKNGRTIMLVTG